MSNVFFMVYEYCKTLNQIDMRKLLKDEKKLLT